MQKRRNAAASVTEAGAPEGHSEIEVTLAMMEAGRRVLSDGFTLDDLACGDISPDRVVVEVFQAMFRARQGTQ
jgi:hypothetical protein